MKAERLEDDDVAEGLWFTEILQEGVLGLWSTNGTEEEIERKRELLFSWGYGEEGTKTNLFPSTLCTKGFYFKTTLFLFTAVKPKAFYLM